MPFKDKDLQISIERDGFVVLDNFFSPEEVTRLRGLLVGFEKYTEAYQGISSDPINDVEKGIFFTRHFQDLEREEAIRLELSAACNLALNRFLSVDYKNVGALGIFKRANSAGSTVDLHVHHSNLAPDSALPGLSLFAPLDDLDDALGPLALIKGSHELWKNDISYTLTYIKEAYPQLYPLMNSYLTTVSPSARQAILFDQFTIHKGFPNTHRSTGRLAITAEFIPKNFDCVLFLPKFDERGRVASLHGRRVTKLPLRFSKRHRWVPEHLGEEVQTIDPYRVREISEDEFRRCCRPSNGAGE